MKLPQLSSRELRRILEEHGFLYVRQSGSHQVFRHEDGRQIVLPMHSNRDLKPGLLLAILKRAGIEKTTAKK